MKIEKEEDEQKSQLSRRFVLDFGGGGQDSNLLTFSRDVPYKWGFVHEFTTGLHVIPEHVIVVEFQVGKECFDLLLNTQERLLLISARHSSHDLQRILVQPLF